MFTNIHLDNRGKIQSNIPATIYQYIQPLQLDKLKTFPSSLNSISMLNKAPSINISID